MYTLTLDQVLHWNSNTKVLYNASGSALKQICCRIIHWSFKELLSWNWISNNRLYIYARRAFGRPSGEGFFPKFIWKLERPPKLMILPERARNQSKLKPDIAIFCFKNPEMYQKARNLSESCMHVYKMCTYPYLVSFLGNFLALLCMPLSAFFFVSCIYCVHIAQLIICDVELALPACVNRAL